MSGGNLCAEGTTCVQCLYGSAVSVCLGFQELSTGPSLYILLFWGWWMLFLLCLHVFVFCKMGELILCENLGMWGAGVQPRQDPGEPSG